MPKDVNGTVYLLHFDRKLAHAQHYIGWTEQSPEYRLQDHLNNRNRAARIVVAAVAAGIGVTIARVWPGETRSFERALKKRANAPRICPLCRAAKAASSSAEMGGVAAR